MIANELFYFSYMYLTSQKNVICLTSKHYLVHKQVLLITPLSIRRGGGGEASF